MGQHQVVDATVKYHEGEATLLPSLKCTGNWPACCTRSDR